MFKMIGGEAKSCTPQMTASRDETTLPTIFSNYKLEDIYNADEFGLFYQALPNKTLHLKSEKCVGGRHSKTRLTGMASANATGEKLPMFVIGKSARPRCFAGFRKLPCRYRSQKRVGWTVFCSKSGSESSIESFWEKAEKLHLLWIIAQRTNTLKG